MDLFKKDIKFARGYLQSMAEQYEVIADQFGEADLIQLDGTRFELTHDTIASMTDQDVVEFCLSAFTEETSLNVSETVH